MIINREKGDIDVEQELIRQRNVIDKLQETIKLLKFDVGDGLKEIRRLKERLKRKEETQKNIRAELMKMKRKNDFSDINKVLAMSNDGWSDYYDE